MNIFYSKLLKSEFNRTFFERSVAYMSTHPAFEIRSSAIKSYILFRGFKEDLSEKIKNYKQFEISLSLLRKRAQILSFFVFNKWGRRLIYCYIGISILFPEYRLGNIIPGINLPEISFPNIILPEINFPNIYSMDYINELFIIVIVDFMIRSLYSDHLVSFKKFQKLKKMRKVQDHIVRKFHQKRTMGEPLSSAHFLRTFNRSIRQLQYVHFIYQHGEKLRFLRYRNGLAFNKYRSLKNTSQLLQDISSEWLNDPDFLNLILEALDKIPSFALKNWRLRRVIENIFRVP